MSAGGSLSNTLVALARLGQAEDELRASGALRVGMAAVAGSDPQVRRLPLCGLPTCVSRANRQSPLSGDTPLCRRCGDKQG